MSGAVIHPGVNGVYEKQDETHADKVVYKHSTASIFLAADTRSCCHGNWHINSQVEGGKVFYWANKSEKFPLQKGGFYIAGTAPPKQSQLVITYKDSSGKNYNFLISSYFFGILISSDWIYNSDDT